MDGPLGHTGGKVGFDKRRFAVASQVPGKSVELRYVSPDGEENYPGTLTVRVSYELDDTDTLNVTMQATGDRATPVNLAQHTYWNLAGHGEGSILDHTIHIRGDHYTPVDDVQIPTGEIVSVLGTPFDFTEARTVGERIEETQGGYDHNYVLFGLGSKAKDLVKHGAAFATPQLAVTLVDPGSGRAMDLSTTAPGMQFYSGNFLDGSLKGKAGAVYAKHAGLALETQGFPDAVNQPGFPSVILRPGEEYVHKMSYRFYTVPT